MVSPTGPLAAGDVLWKEGCRRVTTNPAVEVNEVFVFVWQFVLFYYGSHLYPVIIMTIGQMYFALCLDLPHSMSVSAVRVSVGSSTSFVRFLIIIALASGMLADFSRSVLQALGRGANSGAMQLIRARSLPRVLPNRGPSHMAFDKTAKTSPTRRPASSPRLDSSRGHHRNCESGTAAVGNYILTFLCFGR